MADDDKSVADLGEAFPKTEDEIRQLRERGLEAARDLCAFLDRSPTPFHAARAAAERLRASGFGELSERDAWTLAPGDKRYLIRGGGTLVAFIVGSEPPARAGFRLIGAHTDSPNLRIKPNADVSVRGYEQVGVEI